MTSPAARRGGSRGGEAPVEAVIVDGVAAAEKTHEPATEKKGKRVSEVRTPA
jgi:hypothetical protein